MMRTTVVMLACVILLNADAEKYSKKVWDYVATHNGDYTNIQRIREGFTNHTLARIITRPVSVPALGPGPVTLIELAEQGVLGFRHIVVPSEGEDNVLKLTLYNFTGWNISSEGQYNTDLLANLTKDDFWNEPGCVAGLEMFGPGVFFGDWPICNRVVNGSHPAWGLILTCNRISATVPVGGDEVRNFVPYDIILAGPKFPLINPPPGYVSPCDKS